MYEIIVSILKFVFLAGYKYCYHGLEVIVFICFNLGFVNIFDLFLIQHRGGGWFLAKSISGEESQ